MADVGSANVNITADDSNARSTISGFNGFLKQTASIATGIFAGIAAFKGVAEGIKGAWDSTIGANASMESYQNTLAVVLKSSEKATATLEWAKQFAGSTPFEIPGIVEATTTLATYGISAQDTLGSIGDMASVMGKPLMQAVEAVADAQAGELERLKEFGITKDMLIEKSAEMGKKEIVNAKGQITDMEGLNEALFAIMEERYSGGMELQSKTFNGMVSNVNDAMGQIATELSKPIFERLKQGLQSVVPLLGGVTQLVKGDIKGAMDTFTDAFGQDRANQIMGFFESFRNGIQAAQNWILQFKPAVKNLLDIAIGLGPTFQVVGGAIAVAFVKLAEVLPPIVNKITEIGAAITQWEAFTPIVVGLVAALATYKTTVAAITTAQKIYNTYVTISTALIRANRAAHLAMVLSGGGVKGVLLAMRAAMRSLNLTMLANPFVLIATLLVGLGVALVVAYQKSETFRNIVNAAWASIKSGFMAFINFFTTTLPIWVTNVITWFTNLKNQAVAKITELVTAVLTWWTNLKTQSTSSLMNLVMTVLTWFTNLKDQTVAKIMQLVNQVLTWWNTLQMRTMAIIQLLINTAVMIFTTLSTRVMAIITPFITFFVQTFENMKLLVLGIISILISLITLDMEGFKLGVLAIITAFKNQAVNIFTLFKTVVTSIITTWWNSVKMLFTAGKAALIATVTAIKTGIIVGFTALVNGAKALFQTWWLGMKLMFTAGKNALIATGQALKSGLINGFQALKSGAINIWQALVNGIKNFLSNLKSDSVNKVNSIKSSITNGFNSAKTAAVNAVRNLYNSVTTWLGNVKSKFSDMKSSIVRTVSGIDLYSIGKDIIQGLINGIGSMARAAANKVRDIGNSIKSAIKGALDSHSPSRVMIGVGVDTVRGLIIGLDNMIRSTKKKAVEVAKAAMPQPKKLFQFKGNDPLTKYFNAILEDGDYLNDWITHLPAGVRDQARQLGKQVAQFEGLANGQTGEVHNHYWNVKADEINEVQKLVAMINSLNQTTNKGVF